MAIQDGVIEPAYERGKSASVSVTVTSENTAKKVGSGTLNVFATPMMIALMESAACACLADGLEPGQTSVGTRMDVGHTAASLPGAVITATATIESVKGRRIEFEVAAMEGAKEIGRGRHTRVIVDEERFMGKISLI